MAIPIPQDDQDAKDMLDQMAPIPYGVYDGFISKTEEATVKSEDSDYYGKPVLVVTFDITVNGHARKCWRRFIASGKPLGFLYKFLENIGIPQAEVGASLDGNVLVGRPCRVEIKKPKNSEDPEAWEVGNILKPSAVAQAASNMP